jgi:hypothetical protein
VESTIVTHADHHLIRLFRELHRFAIHSYRRFVGSAYSTICYLAIVGAVSVYDIILTIKYAFYLKYMEENPIGRWLMQLDTLENGCLPDLTWFLTAKSIGTLIVLAGIYVLVHWKGRLGHPVGIGVSSFQLALASYLTFATTPT